ncbi:MAG: C40 family peptidase [Steroidobacteraceae bacterium]
MRISPQLSACAAAVTLLSLLVGCGTVAYTQEASSDDQSDSAAAQPAETMPLPINLGEEIALRAISLVGKPYRYGGADLQGFDCSGMVYFIHQALGIEVPRTAADQQRAAVSVNKVALLPGDLLFFRTTSAKRISHVGIYVGDNRFVHAPQSGKLIELRTLDDAYYGKRLAGTGRFYPTS